MSPNLSADPTCTVPSYYAEKGAESETYVEMETEVETGTEAESSSQTESEEANEVETDSGSESVNGNTVSNTKTSDVDAQWLLITFVFALCGATACAEAHRRKRMK